MSVAIHKLQLVLLTTFFPYSAKRMYTTFLTQKYDQVHQSIYFQFTMIFSLLMLYYLITWTGLSSGSALSTLLDLRASINTRNANSLHTNRK